MGDEALLRRLVVIGRDHQNAVRPGGLGLFGLLEDVFGVVAADADDDLHAALTFFHRELHELVVLLGGVGGVLACGAADEDGGGAAGVLEVDQFGVLFIVHAVFKIGRDDGGAGTGEYRCLCHFLHTS